jgi:exosortase A
LIPLTAEAGGPFQSAAARWRWPVFALTLAGASVVFANWRPLQALVGTWTNSPSFEHGYVVVGVTAALIWARRRRIASEDPRASIAGVLVTAAAAVLGAIGAAGAMLEVEQFAFVLFLHGIVLAILGPRIWRILAFPLFYLFFAIPAGDLLVPWLRDFTARSIVAMLTAAGTPAVLDGYLIRLPHADYRVAEACAGLRFLLVSVASSVLAAHLLIRSWRRRILFLAIAIALPLSANAVRAVLLIWLAANGLLDPQAAVLHFTYGLGFTGVLLSLLMLLAWFMRERSVHPEPFAFVSHRPVRRVPVMTVMLAVSFLAFLPVLVRSSSAGLPARALQLRNPIVAGSWAISTPGAETLATRDAAGADA